MLTTFDVAAHHLSFTKAASEMNISQAAVSQQIRILENLLDVSLFIRKHKSLELTTDGKLLLRSVNNGLDIIAGTIRTFKEKEFDHPINISTTLAMSNMWLASKIQSYREVYPDSRFRIFASDTEKRSSFDGIHISLDCGNENSNTGSKKYLLFEETVVPVCSPEYCNDNGPFNKPGDLLNAKLLELEQEHWSADAINWTPVDWSIWFSDNKIDTFPSEYSITSNNCQLLVQLALESQGVILGFLHLVEDYLKNKTLVKLIDRPFCTNRGYYLLVHRNAKNHKEVPQFIEWLLAQANL